MLSEIGTGRTSDLNALIPEVFFRDIEVGQFDDLQTLRGLIALFEAMISMRRQLEMPIHKRWDINNLEHGLNLLRSRYEDIYNRRSGEV